MIGALIIWSENNGYGLTFGDAYRSPECAAVMKREGAGIINSLHTKRLAVDFNLFIGDRYATDSAEYEPLGVFWESIGGTWGGRFKKRDGNHFSLEHGGVK